MQSISSFTPWSGFFICSVRDCIFKHVQPKQCFHCKYWLCFQPPCLPINSMIRQACHKDIWQTIFCIVVQIFLVIFNIVSFSTDHSKLQEQKAKESCFFHCRLGRKAGRHWHCYGAARASMRKGETRVQPALPAVASLAGCERLRYQSQKEEGCRCWPWSTTVKDTANKQLITFWPRKAPLYNILNVGSYCCTNYKKI